MTTTLRFAKPMMCLLLILLAAPPSATAFQEELAANVVVQGDQGTSTMKVMLGSEGQLRMDMTSPGGQGEVSTVFKPDGMLMIMHSQRMYMEFPKEMLDRMREMMGGMGQQQMKEAEEFDPTKVTFEQTGKTETINGMEAFEVAVHGEDGKTSHVWMSESSEHGLFEVFSRMLEPLSAMRMPGGMGGGINPMQKMQAMMQIARTQGLPAGKVVRVEGDGNSMTLGEVVAGPLDAATWSAPDGYTKQAMPGFGRRQ